MKDRQFVAAIDLAWAAGLFEGEGTITISKGRISLHLSSTDEDAIDRPIALLGVGRKNGPYVRDDFKPVYRWDVNKQADAAGLLMTFFPFLTARRRARAEEALVVWRHHPSGRQRQTHCRRGHEMSGSNLYVHAKSWQSTLSSLSVDKKGSSMKAPRQYVIACDFDRTIHNPDDREPGYKMGKPYEGAKETLTRLHELGAKIVIHTCRARALLGLPDIDSTWQQRNGSIEHVAEWLVYFEIPFDEITAIKPIADVYVDDRAVPFLGDWRATERELLALFYLGVRP